MRKVLVIGGGVAGLAAGIYLKTNGYDVEIIEKNTVVGGACIGWERKGCYIDGCIHWLTGVDPKTNMNKLWRETRALANDTKICFQDDLYTHKFLDGTTLVLRSNLEQFERALLEFAPEDKKAIKKLVRLIRKFQRIDPPSGKPVELMNLIDLLGVALSLGSSLPRIIKASSLSCVDLSKNFKNEKLRDLFAHFMAPGYNVMSMMYMLGHITARDGGIPIGGSLAFAERMEAFYLSIGGSIRKNTSVNKIIVENDVAKGVILNNGEELRSDWVVSTVPVEHCLAKLLEGKYKDKKFDMRLADEKTYPIYTYTTVVLKCPINVKDKSLALTTHLKDKFTIDKEYDRLTFRNYAYDTSLNKTPDCCVIQATVHGNDDMYFWWKEHKQNGTYKEQKKRIAEEFLAIAKQVYSDVADALEVIDVVTPCTYERYLNSRHGSFQGFIHTSKGKSLMHSGRIKGLKNFILAGQWIIRSGGLPTAVMSGKFAAQRICHTDKKKFVTP